MKKYNVVVVGAGMVGRKMVEILRERNFPCASLRVLATRTRQEEIAGEKFLVEVTDFSSFDQVDLAFFAGTEGEKGASQRFGWPAVEKGCVVIDNGDDFRMDERVPLVVPEVNPQVLKKHQRFVSNPNCSTIQMVVALAPLHKIGKIKRVIVSTYQAVSGTGQAAAAELESQTRAWCEGGEIRTTVYPHQIAFNLFPHISGLSPDFPGYFKEETKMIKETRKILDEPDLLVSATCVRVPVFNSHSEAITVQLEKNISPDQAREILSQSPGIKVVDEPDKNLYPTPLLASGRDEVFVGRIRRNPCLENALDLWVVADNIRKGAATNAVQIAEELIRHDLI